MSLTYRFLSVDVTYKYRWLRGGISAAVRKKNFGGWKKSCIFAVYMVLYGAVGDGVWAELLYGITIICNYDKNKLLWQEQLVKTDWDFRAV